MFASLAKSTNFYREEDKKTVGNECFWLEFHTTCDQNIATSYTTSSFSGRLAIRSSQRFMFTLSTYKNAYRNSSQLEIEGIYIIVYILYTHIQTSI